MPIGPLDLGEAFGNALVKRRHDADLVAGVRECFPQSANHVAQPTRLRIRMHFAAGQQNSHRVRCFGGFNARGESDRNALGPQIRLQHLRHRHAAVRLLIRFD